MELEEWSIREGRTYMGQAVFKRPRLDRGTAGVLLAQVAADPLWSLSPPSPAFTQIQEFEERLSRSTDGG